MAGLTSTGLTINTLDDVVTALNAQAATIFSDLVTTGDTVDTSANSALGRIIGVVAPALADVWQAIQQVNDSFNPNTATGYALDNMVALSGINRLVATPTRSQVVLGADINTTISSPLGAIYSSVTQRTYSIVNPVIMSESSASGIGFVVITPVDGDTYTVSYTVDAVNYIDTSVVASTGSTKASILAQLQTALNNALSATFTTTLNTDGRLYLNRIDPFQTVSFTTSVNLRIEKVNKPGVVQDDVSGPYPAAAYAIDTVSVPIAGWDSVYNPIAATTGRLKETDEELRERFRNSKFVQSINIFEALLDALKNVDGVTDVALYENDTAYTNSLGVPMKSFMPIVLGGLSTDVADAIWENKPNGIESAGNTTVQIADSQGYIHPISYTAPTGTPVYMSLNITNTGALPGDAIATLRQNLVTYGVTNYLIGDDVIYSRFYTPINAVDGHQVNSFTIGTTPNPTGTSNIVIPFDGVATFDAANITVTIS